VYFSDQAHSCVAKALHVLDVPADHRRVVETGADFRFTAESAEQIIAADAARGLRPAVLVATAGTTNTGTVDDLDGLASLAKRLGMWFHVDAAYGGPARLCAGSGDPLLSTAHADSIVLDPHKWLFQPYDIGALLVRRPGALERNFALTPEYLRDVAASGIGEVDLRNRGIELTRRSRAIKAWMTISSAGRVGLTEAVRRGIERATVAENRLRAGGVWEIVSPAQLGIVTFRHRRRPQGHESAAASLTASGLAAVTCTRLLGQSTLRLCTINPRTTDADIDDTITALEDLLGMSPRRR
jgi:glutamate/tyrosine decarboxylase-like PLP-dependent enzyme